MKELITLKTLEEYRSFLASQTDDYEILLLKVSSHCTVSFVIQKIFEHWFNGVDKSAKLRCGIVEVISAREVSNQIAKDFGIKHESPQAIWLSKDGKVKWSESHHRITVEAFEHCLSSIQSK
ncbi:MAG: bacillithiol system redox-active protein YtxJ [Ignavibacteriaceae bacterium]|jgi:bacillithiol system protein YtxJ